MRQSTLFTKTRREAPKDEVSKNAELLVRAAFIHKQQAGVYAFMPLGHRVIEKIVKIIREEMNFVGGQEISLTALQDKETWEKSGRWDDAVMDNWFKTSLKNGTELGLGITHEEPLTQIMKDHIRSFRDLPVYTYQFQVKFRNELRAKSGILRGREFLMKDLYSFSRNQEDHLAFYEKMKNAYVNIFKRAGVGDITYITFASGGTFAPFSHEFQMLTDAGEDTIYIHKDKKIAVNHEVYNDEVLSGLDLKKDELEEVRGVEVGNIFSLGTKFSDAFGLNYKDEDGTDKPVIMGSYGIGVPRLMGAVVEALADEKGMIWPINIAPYEVHLIQVPGSVETQDRAEALYDFLLQNGVEVLFDDRDARAGEKFADSDLIGIPVRCVVSDKNTKDGDDFLIEVKDRKTGEIINIKKEDILMKVSMLKAGS